MKLGRQRALVAAARRARAVAAAAVTGQPCPDCGQPMLPQEMLYGERCARCQRERASIPQVIPNGGLRSWATCLRQVSRDILTSAAERASDP